MKTRATTLLVLVALVALIVSSVVHAGIPRKYSLVVPVGPAPHLFPHAKPFKQMSLSELEKHQQAALAHYRYVSRFFLRWRSKNAQARDLYGLTIKACRFTGILEPANYCWYAAAARWTAKELAETQKKIEARRTVTTPAHIALWRCIEAGESGGDGVHPGSESASNGTHFNVLQMTNPWAGHNPIGQSYATIEAWAEQEYAANHFSRLWLVGQWAQTVGPCLQYA